MLKTMYGKKTYLANIRKQFVLPKSLRKKEQRMLALYEDHLSEIRHCKKYAMFYSKKHFHPNYLGRT